MLQGRHFVFRLGPRPPSYLYRRRIPYYQESSQQLTQFSEHKSFFSLLSIKFSAVDFLRLGGTKERCRPNSTYYEVKSKENATW